MKVRIALETGQDISEFVEILDSLPPTVKVYVTDNNNFRISARSMLFLAVARIEWDQLWCECDTDIYSKIERFVVV